jgi:hypothetical protein
MYYKLKLEYVDYRFNTIKSTEVWVTEEELNRINSIDGLKMAAEKLIDKYRSDNYKNKNKDHEQN